MRCSFRGFLLSTASCLAFSGTASAADMPVKAPPVGQPPLWAGAYIGLNVGAAWHRWRFIDVDNQLGLIGGAGVGLGSVVNNEFWSETRAAFTGGGQVGYNFQSGRVVYGVEADINWVDGKNSFSRPSVVIGGATATASTEFDWFATVRGRLGLTLSPTMIYVTGGAAFAHVRDVIDANFAAFNATGPVVKDRVLFGYAVGGGVEHMINSDWTVKLEGLYIGLENSSATKQMSGQTYRSEFKHSAVIARIGLNRRLAPWR